MSNDKDNRGERDRGRTASEERPEIDYLIEQTGASRQEIADAIKVVGRNWEKIEEYLRNKRVF
jgi:hypothetical protein